MDFKCGSVHNCNIYLLHSQRCCLIGELPNQPVGVGFYQVGWPVHQAPLPDLKHFGRGRSATRQNAAATNGKARVIFAPLTEGSECFKGKAYPLKAVQSLILAVTRYAFAKTFRSCQDKVPYFNLCERVCVLWAGFVAGHPTLAGSSGPVKSPQHGAHSAGDVVYTRKTNFTVTSHQKRWCTACGEQRPYSPISFDFFFFSFFFYFSVSFSSSVIIVSLISLCYPDEKKGN